MNRLSPLIVRAHRPSRALQPALIGPQCEPVEAVAAPPSPWLQDLRLFATAWAGGFVFFSTFIA
jgi:hypothetical protein